MTTRTGEIAAGSLASKTFRVRKCGVKLYLPGSVEFQCQLEKHTPETPHAEIGYVTMPNGTARKYTMTWKDEGVAQLRQNKRTPIRPKVRAIK